MALINSKALTDHVYERIKTLIAEGYLAPGEKINKKELEEQLGVSQTPINDALSRLLGEQFIEQETRKGYFVKEFSCGELVDLFATRAAIEGMGARLAVERSSDHELTRLRSFVESFDESIALDDPSAYSQVDIDFHTYVISLSRNAMLVGIYERYGYMLKANLQGLVRGPSATLPEHRAIIEALIARDGTNAQNLMTEHIMRSREVLRRSCHENETP